MPLKCPLCGVWGAKPVRRAQEKAANCHHSPPPRSLDYAPLRSQKTGLEEEPPQNRPGTALLRPCSGSLGVSPSIPHREKRGRHLCWHCSSGAGFPTALPRTSAA